MSIMDEGGNEGSGSECCASDIAKQVRRGKVRGGGGRG